MKKELIFLLIACVMAGLPLSSLRAQQITDVFARASSMYDLDTHPIRAVNGAGLTGNAHINAWAKTMWIPLMNEINGAYIIIDLKKNYQLNPTNTLRVWNGNQAGETDRGIKSATFSYSLDGLIFTDVTNATTDAISNTFDQASGLATYSNYNTVAFNSSPTGRYIKITVNGGVSTGNYGDASFVILSEAQAFGTFASEPTNSPIANVGASASSMFNLVDRHPIWAVNFAGLNGYAHTNAWANYMWLTEANDIDGAYIIIDLKMNYRLAAINTLRIWNYNQSGFPDAGIKSATFSYSLGSLTYIAVTGATTDAISNTFDQASGLNTYSNYNTVAFNSISTGRYIKITVNGGSGSGNYGNASYVGLSEAMAFGTFASDPTNFLGAQVTVSNATASSSYSGAGVSVTNLINGSGLTGLEHDDQLLNMWIMDTGVTNGYVDFDLGLSRELGAMRLWNQNQINTARGMRTVDILVSDDPGFTNGVITNYNDIELLHTSRNLDQALYDNPQIIDMKRVRGRYVRISNVGNSSPIWGTDYPGLSEVQFFLFVPPPPPSGTMFSVR